MGFIPYPHNLCNARTRKGKMCVNNGVYVRTITIDDQQYITPLCTVHWELFVWQHRENPTVDRPMDLLQYNGPEIGYIAKYQLYVEEFNKKKG